MLSLTKIHCWRGSKTGAVGSQPVSQPVFHGDLPTTELRGRAIEGWQDRNVADGAAYDFDVRCRTSKIPVDNSAEAVAAYKDAAAQGRALGLRSALRRMPGSFATAATAKDSEGDTLMTGVALRMQSHLQHFDLVTVGVTQPIRLCQLRLKSIIESNQELREGLSRPLSQLVKL
ncbi:hypothetical protein E4U27_007964 [Claviceps purpurea]|nr:hypothetical protein E4U27_007964 [Claviceps purpurea]